MDAIDPPPRRVDADSLKAEIVDKLAYAIGKDPIVAQPHDWLAATILVDARPGDRPLDGVDPRRLPQQLQARLLPLG